jgi:Domain of unknown function (DUF4082)/Bacterial Ig-like domain/Purple acid Phosphatase, N-terminal domain/Bacterial Ig domain
VPSRRLGGQRTYGSRAAALGLALAALAAAGALAPVAAGAATDTTPPTATITEPTDGATVAGGQAVTVAGTATDGESGGVVATVEVSTDGQTWRDATGTTSWRYAWTPSDSGSATIRARAVDDSGNVQSPVASIKVTVGSAAQAAAAAGSTCPCTIFDSATRAPSQSSADNDGQPIELGVKFRSDTNGFVTGIRYWRATNNTGTHVGHLWSSSGTQLASATFTSESASGWQQVLFSTPVAVTANTTYVASYWSGNGFYSADDNYFTTAIDRPPLHVQTSATAGGNGVYRYGASGFPTATFAAANYWVDVSFTLSNAPDTTPPKVTALAPADNALATDPGAAVTATFDEALNPSTVNGTNFQLRDAANNLVSATVTYDTAAGIAVLTPQSRLAYSTRYTATLKGGAGGIADVAGNTLAQSTTWSFTTGAAPPPPPTDGPGGPILVITSSGDPFTSYYAEILRAEGMNDFLTADLLTVTAQTLASYDVAILAPTTLNAAQVTMLRDWVTSGGNLIAMRPDKNLAGLLGLTDAGTTLANAYLRVDTSTAPGAGIAGATMQFHGTADRYSLNGAGSVAALYSSASTTTNSPAVTLRGVGTSGGQAAAFTYDLARSVVYTRQGNPAWAGDERDGFAPIRPDDMFFGAKAGNVQPDWVDLGKVAIPQADEQQRLLANLILQMNLDRKPLPRFWYLPSADKAAVVMTGDDHGRGGTSGQFDRFIADSPAGCSVADWECVRSSSYLYPSTPLSDAQLAAYQAAGFEIGLHYRVSGPNDCNNFGSAASLSSDLGSQLQAFASRWPSLAAPKTLRTHCIVFSDWSSEPSVELTKGIRLDANYYYWPGSWVQDRPGMFTGSGFPMRFAAANGALIDVYQATTQLTDESDQDIPTEIKALIDKALGTEGYYGVFTANMHTDSPSHPGADAIVAEATSRGVPVISARQLLDWTDGRNASSFSAISYASNRLRFTVNRNANARNLQGMVPLDSAGGSLQSLTRNGSTISTTSRTIKGIGYAFFAASSGDYVATYGADTVAPTITGVAATAHPDGTATVTWTTDEPASSRVQYGTSPTSLSGDASDATRVTAHSVTLSGLAPATTYHYRVSSTDAAGNSATSPATTDAPRTFTTPAATLADSSVADFRAGTPGTATFAGATGATTDGEVQLAPTIGEEFDGSALPSGWTTTAWGSGGAGTVSGGALVVDGARTGTTATYTAPRTLEFDATFASTAFQHAGFGTDFNAQPWAMFSTGGGSLAVGLYARTNGTATAIAGVSPTAPHRYRIVRTASSVQYYVDGTLVATHNVAISAAMRPLVSDFNVGGGSLTLSWLRMSPYAAAGTFTSRVLDAGRSATWGTLDSTVTAPAGTAVTFETRSGNSATPDATWSAWQAVGSGGAIASPAGRYVQYRANLSSTSTALTPSLERVAISYG